jgi:hypothetical protein
MFYNLPCPFGRRGPRKTNEATNNRAASLRAKVVAYRHLVPKLLAKYKKSLATEKITLA